MTREVLAFSTSSGKTYALSRRDMKLVKVNNGLIDMLFKVKYKWSVVVAVLTRAKTGKVYVVSHQVTLNQKLRKAQLAPYLAKLHEQVGYDARYNYPDCELEDAAWLADPKGNDWSEDTICQALKSINC